MPYLIAQVSEASVYVNGRLHQQHQSLCLNLAQLAAKHKNVSSPQERQPVPPGVRGGKLTVGTIYHLFSLPNKNSKFLPHSHSRGSHKL